ncbi:MAG: FixH family protein [Ignavibacteriales bacterium]|nr:FixH family protein [Ignavibacteriales bacterium]
MFADDSLKMGYNKIYIQIFDSATGTAASKANITLSSLMNMATMYHASPVEQADSTTKDGYFVGAVVFIMATMEPTDTWTLTVNFKNSSNGKAGIVTIPVSIKSSTNITSFVASDSSKLFTTYIPIAKPQVGINDIEFTIHQKASMMSFPAVNDVSVEMTPDMPTMGHGSPNNVHPTLTANGHYKGKVNFTMTGQWRITLVIKKGLVTLGTTSFTIIL